VLSIEGGTAGGSFIYTTKRRAADRGARRRKGITKMVCVRISASASIIHVTGWLVADCGVRHRYGKRVTKMRCGCRCQE
jgi:hypothetical protein